jgi:hypothetical protein
VVADPARIETELLWSAKRDLDEMVRSAWDAWQFATPTTDLAPALSPAPTPALTGATRPG